MCINLGEKVEGSHKILCCSRGEGGAGFFLLTMEIFREEGGTLGRLILWAAVSLQESRKER